MNTKGFTLIELLVVVLIIGVLAAVALPQYTTAIEKSRATEALTLSGSLRYAAERYLLQKEEWPGNGELKKLDIELPTNPACRTAGTGTGTDEGFGGKNFCLRVTKTVGNTNLYTITATRSSGPTYSIVTATDDGGKSWKRTCTYNENNESAKFCYAIAGSKTDADGGF